MSDDYKNDLLSAIDSISNSREPIFIEGVVGLSKELNSTYIIISPDEYLLIPNERIVGTTPEIDGRMGVYVSSGAQIWKCRKGSVFSVEAKRSFRVDEENILPARVVVREGDPIAGSKEDQKKLTPGKSLEGACKVFEKSCVGRGSFINNCAHYLSNALILAGYSELNQSQDCVGARCNEDNKCNLGSYLNHRVIRAKDLRCWFASKAKKKATSVKKNSGSWAVYQERASDRQGHVAIIDTGSWRYYGTSWFSDWVQEYYQW